MWFHPFLDSYFHTGLQSILPSHRKKSFSSSLPFFPVRKTILHVPPRGGAACAGLEWEEGEERGGWGWRTEERMEEARRWGECPTSTPGSESPAPCKVLFPEMHLWSCISHNRLTGDPSLGLPSPQIKCSRSLRQIQAQRYQGTTEVAALPVGLPYLERGPGGGASLGPRCSLRGPVRGTGVLSLPPLSEGQPATQKGCVGVGVGEVF